MPLLLAEILNYQGSAHLIGVGSLSYLYMCWNAKANGVKKVGSSGQLKSHHHVFCSMSVLQK